MNRELAKIKAMSRDCHCVKGRDRDTNYNSIIDEIFDWHKREVDKLTTPDAIDYIKSNPLVEGKIKGNIKNHGKHIKQALPPPPVRT